MKEEFEDNESLNLKGIIEAFLDALDDKNQDVKQSIIKSIERISENNSFVVISTAVCFWERHKKISTEHKTSLLNVMSNICKHINASLNLDLASSIADLAVIELTGETENEAANVLIALSKTHCIQAMGGLLNKLEPGVLPNHVIVSTIGKLAVANPRGMLSFIKLTLTIILPMLNQIREENLKQAICFTIGKFCEAINDCILNTEDKAPEVNKQIYREDIYAAFEFLTSNWLKTFRYPKSNEIILTALIPMISFLFQEVDNEDIMKLIPVCLNFCKKQDIRLAAVKVLTVILSCSTIDGKVMLHLYIEQIHQTLFGFVSIFPFEASRDALLTHYEVLQCSRSLVILYPEESLDRILQHLKSSNSNQRARALVVLKHLINTLPPEDDGSLNKIALSLQESLAENGVLQMVGAIVALAARPTFSLSSSQRTLFVRYIVFHCGMKSEDPEAHTEALYLLATTVDGAESWLWPCLIDTLLDSTYVTSVTSVLRALSPLATKIISNEHSSKRDFPGSKVLSRCLELINEPTNQLAIVTFLKAVAPLVGHQVKPYWDTKLLELSEFLQNKQKDSLINSTQRNLIWEEKVIEWLEESVKLEGKSWGDKLADELALKSSAPGVAPLLALLCNNNAHITLLVEHARSYGVNKEFARAVGICAKRHLNTVLKVMEEFCIAEDNRKVPVKILGFMKDFVKDFAKAVAANEAAKTGLLQSYAEIAQRGNPGEFFPAFEKHVIPWTINSLTTCKELSTKEAGLSVLEQVGKAIHPSRWPEFTCLHAKVSALAVLTGMLQSSSGYRPLQLYPAILKAAISLIRLPPILNKEENDIFLSGVLDKTIGATTEIVLLSRTEILEQVVDELGTLSNEIISDSADTLAALVDVLLPWMQSNSNIEKKTTLLVLDTVLRSYYNSIKYTYPGGKFDAGKLVGRTLSWCAITDISLRPLVLDCVLFSLNIACRHRSLSPDSALDDKLKQIKKNIISNDSTIFFKAIKDLAEAISERIPNGEIIGLAEGLIDGLLYGGEASLVASIALSQHFQIKGSEMCRNDVDLIHNIITQMRHMENASCRNSTATAIALLMVHHPEEVTERLLFQPLPLDRATELCWKEIGSNDLGHRALELLLIKLEASNPYADITVAPENNMCNTASLPSLSAMIALRYLLHSPNVEVLIDKQLARLLSILLKYLAAWLHVDAPAAVVNTKYGYVPNREANRIYPHTEVYSVLTNVLTIVNSSAASSLLNETVFSSQTHAEESVISTVRTLIRCISIKTDILSSMSQSVGKLMTSRIAIQRAVATAFYAELIGKVDCGVIWLDGIINSLYEAKADSSSLVRTLAIVGLARIAFLDQKLIDVYFDNCVDALLEGLEGSASGRGGNDVVLESLRGLSVFLSVQYKTCINPRVVMALKPFIEKENTDMKLTAISVLSAVATNWQKTAAPMHDYDLADYMLLCLPCLLIRLEDSNIMVAKITQETLYKIANILQCEKLSHVMRINLGPQAKFNFETFSRDLIDCLKNELPQRAEELRNTIVRGYSRSENHYTRATSALLLGMFGAPRPEDIQRLLQLLRDKENIVKMRASQALSCCSSFLA